MLPIGWLLEYEGRHASLLKDKVGAGVRAARRYLNGQSSSDARHYVELLEKVGSEVLLVGRPDTLKDVVTDAEQYLPEGKFWLKNAQEYNREFAQINAVLYNEINYEAFVRMRGRGVKEPWGGWMLAKVLMQKIKYCPYCNAETVYAFNFMKNGELKLAKSAFDHFYPRDRYPFLGLSLYNLIPSCTRCNTSLKHDEYRAVLSMAHPYVDDVHQGMKFRVLFRKHHAFVFCRDQDIDAVLFRERVAGQCPGGVEWDRMFQHEAVYTELFKSEAADAYCSAIRYPKTYIENCTDDLRRAGLPEADIERLLYRCPIDDSQVDRYRHGKMIVDIVKDARRAAEECGG